MSESWHMVRNTLCGDVWKSRQFSVILQYKEPPWHGSIWIKGCALTWLHSRHIYWKSSPGKKCWIPLLCRFFRSWAHSPGTSEMEIRLFLMSVWMTWGSASHWGRTLSTCEKNAVWGKVKRPCGAASNRASLYLWDGFALKSSYECEPRQSVCGRFRQNICNPDI